MKRAVMKAVTISAASLIAAFSSGVGGASATTAHATKSYVIPIISSMTGTGAEYGLSDVAGVQVAVNHINATGGVDGYRLKLHVYDDQGNAALAAEYVRDIINSSDLVALGPVQSETTAAAWPLASQAKLPIVGETQDTSLVSSTQPWSFDAIVTGPVDAEAGVKDFIADNPGIAKTAVAIVDTSNAGSQSTSEYVINDLESEHFKILKTIDITENQPSYASEASVAESLNPGMIVDGGYDTTGGLVLKALRAANAKQPVYFPELSTDALLAAGSSAYGAWSMQPSWPSILSTAGKRFAALYKGVADGAPLEPGTPYMYDGMLAVGAALKASGVLKHSGSVSQRRNTLRRFLHAASVQGLTGVFGFGQRGLYVGAGTFIETNAEGNVISAPTPSSH